MSVKIPCKAEFGDFQTPETLCRKICDLLRALNVSPASIVEPTCGKGSFLRASVDAFPNAEQYLGFEINPDYAEVAARVSGATVLCEDFFRKDWTRTLEPLPEPILAIGNPPWVTNSALSALGSTNLPAKTNPENLRGLDAITGKSNFDISESMLTNLMERLSGRSAVFAMLCKTAVARKVLQNAWVNQIHLAASAIYAIDATDHFGAAVDACLLLCMLDGDTTSHECAVYSSLDVSAPKAMFGLHNGEVLADLNRIQCYDHLRGKSPLKWRSGIKHDCAGVMELKPIGDGTFENGFGEIVELEYTYLYPMLKSSELARSAATPSRYMLVPQRSIGDDTSKIRQSAPQTWDYLLSHESHFSKRSSTIYRNRPRFSVFGVGLYSFSPWKVAISGFYKRLKFCRLGSVDGKPLVLDDTCYFLPCETEEDASILLDLLNSEDAEDFFRALIFWDQKRPITAKLLGSLDLSVLARDLSVSLPMFEDRQYSLAILG